MEEGDGINITVQQDLGSAVEALLRILLFTTAAAEEVRKVTRLNPWRCTAGLAKQHRLHWLQRNALSKKAHPVSTLCHLQTLAHLKSSNHYFLSHT